MDTLYPLHEQIVTRPDTFMHKYRAHRQGVRSNPSFGIYNISYTA